MQQEHISKLNKVICNVINLICRFFMVFFCLLIFLLAMTELKNSPYANVNAAVFGSRDQLCLNQNLQKLSNDEKVDKCKSLREQKGCDFFEKLDINKRNEVAIAAEPILDIEDLHKIGSERGCCPYFMSLERIERADIIFMPYNYLFSPDIQKSIEIGNKLENAVIILDEAHNIPNVCNDCSSASVEVYKALKEIKYVSLRFHFIKLTSVSVFH